MQDEGDSMDATSTKDVADLDIAITIKVSTHEQSSQSSPVRRQN